jgi:hypothetical protein
VSRGTPIVDPANAGNWLVTTRLLLNGGSGAPATFSDASAAKLPAVSDPEYLQGDHVHLVDMDGDADLDLVVSSVNRIVSPATAEIVATPSIRLFTNDGSGAFTRRIGVFPLGDGVDQLQADALAIGDLTGDGAPDVLLVSARAPNVGERGGRLLIKIGASWFSASKALPNFVTVDDLRGVAATLADLDRDGALDVIVSRDESDQTVRNTLVLASPLKDFADATAKAIPAPVTTLNGVDGWRGTKVLVGDVDGDNTKDLVVLRPERAAGADANRSRIRLLRGNGAGVFVDSTTNTPPVSGDEDWRAKDGVLVDLDRDGDLDLAIITDDAVSGGSRSSLRILKNDGAGNFSDATSTSVPAATSYGDRNQGVAIAAAITPATLTPPIEPIHVDLVILHSAYFTGAGPAYFPGLRFLENDGAGVFTRKTTAMPPVLPSSPTQYQGDSVAAGLLDGDGKPDILVTRAQPVGDPQNAGTFVVATRLLVNSGANTFSDVTASRLPAASGADYLQAGRLLLSDLDGDGRLDVALASSAALVDPSNGSTSTGPALRCLVSDANGVFTAATNVFPAADGQDRLQCDGLVAGDLTGDALPELFLVSGAAPNAGGRGGRLLLKLGGVWGSGAKVLPDPSVADDLRGAAAALVDVDRDGDLDVVIVRDESNEAVRNTRVLVNLRNR